MSNFKKKKEQVHKQQKVQKKNPIVTRLDTEAAHPLKNQAPKQASLKKQQKIEKIQKGEKTYKIQRCVTTGQANQSAATVYKFPKTTLSIKQLVKTMNQLKGYLQSEYDSLLSGNISENCYRQINQLLSSNYFRFRSVTFNSALDEFSNVIQALQLLTSKLTNNQKLTEKVFIRDEEDFVLFFKFFFAKPYTLINLPAVRKVVKLLWDQSLFSSLSIAAILNNLRLWIFGISSPLNPSMNKLHKLCTQFSDQISKLVNHKSNKCVYVGVNDSDTLCLTPLMVALIAGNLKGAQKLIKNGASINCCPLTVNSKITNESIQNFRPSGKIVIKKEFGFKERKQVSPIQYLKLNKRNDEIAQIMCWQNFYQLKKLRKNNQIIDSLQMFPNCCFQLDWKQFRGMLCFKDLPQDIVSVYKRDNCLRIDYHANSVGISKKKGNFSLIFKSESKQDNKFFIIDHNEKVIRNILEDKNIKSIKQKFNIIMKYGNAYELQTSELKAIYMGKQNKFTMCVQNYYQNYAKIAHNHKFQNQHDYFKAVVQSEVINYSQLQKNEINAILNQNIVKIDKQKPKFVKSQTNLDVQWVQQALNLTHLTLILKLMLIAYAQSTFFHRLQKIIKLFQDPALRSLKLLNKLPMRSKLLTGEQGNIECEIKNLRYCKLQESIFKLQVRAKQMNFEEVDEPVDLSHLQDTVFMQEMYSIRASRFVGNSEKMLEIQDQQANKKFEELLRLEGIWSDEEDR